MLKKKAFRVFTIITFLVTILNTCFFMSDCFNYNINDLPVGELQFTDSTNPNYLIKVYEINQNGTLERGIRCEMVDISKITAAYESNETENIDQLIANAPTKNIYWQIGVSNAIISWKSDTLIEINDVAFDVTDTVYDWRVYNALEEEE